MKRLKPLKLIADKKLGNPLEGYPTFILNQHKIAPTLIENARKNKQIIYGAQAMNAQLLPILRRPTQDVRSDGARKILHTPFSCYEVKNMQSLEAKQRESE